MPIVRTYSSPFDFVKEKFRKTFNGYVYEREPNILVGRDRIVGLYLKPVALVEGREFKPFGTLHYVCSVKFNLRKLSVKKFYKVLGVVYWGKYFAPLVKILKRNTNTWLDLWFTKKSDVSTPILVIAGNYGVGLIAPYTDYHEDAVDISEVAEVKNMEIPDFNMVKLADELVKLTDCEERIEAWARELGIIVR